MSQCEGSLLILTQDPEQLVVPPGQLVVQAPPEQTWFALHCLPQAPQLKKSLVLFTHLSPHLVNPASQLTPQLDASQVAAPCFGVGHVFPQSPQFCGSVRVETHLRPQRLNPSLQVKSHKPFEQTATPLAGTSQREPQEPQCCVSFCTSTQLWLQLVLSSGQLVTQLPS